MPQPHTVRATLGRPSGLHALSWWLLVLGVGLYCTVSALTLGHLGVPYDLPGGSPLVKFHPGTYVLCLALGCSLLAQGHPLVALGARLRAAPLVAAYLACMLLVAVWAVWRHGTSGAAFIVDTLWMPGLLLLLMQAFSARRHRLLLRWVLALLALNALLALGEYALKVHMVPRYPVGSGLVPDGLMFRSSSLLGHPLANSLVTVTLLPAVVVAGRGHLWRWPLVGLLLMALLAFGSRTALGLGVLVYGGAGLGALLLGAARGRFGYAQLTGGLLAGMLGLTGLAAVVGLTGLGDRILAGMAWDNSAQVRLVVWQALDYLDLFDWWAGMSPEQIATVAERIGLDTRYEAIENFWIALLMQLGLVGFLPFVVGLFCGLWHAVRQAAAPLVWAVPVYLLVASGANTLAAKSVSLSLLLLACVASGAWLRQPQTARAVARSEWAAPQAEHQAPHQAARGRRMVLP